MPVLYTILGIILFFVILFSIPVGADVFYGDKTVVRARWLFLKFTVLDTSKPKKEKKKKEKKEKKNKKKKGDETPAEETPSEETETAETVEKKDEEKPAEKRGNSFLKQLYLDHGYDGMVQMLRTVGRSMSGFFGKLYKTFTIDELTLTMVTCGGDAADTAIKHGKLCAFLYPILGKLVSTCKVKKYDVDVSPDFLGTKSTAEAYLRFHVVPIRITNAAVVLAVQLLFGVLIKLLFTKKKSDKSRKPPKNAPKDGDKNGKTSPSEDGAGQIQEKILDKDGVS